MTQKATTADERFIVKLYEKALAKGDPETPLDYRPIAKALGQKETAMKNILKAMAQANLIKKINDTMICLTSRGISLAQDLLG